MRAAVKAIVRCTSVPFRTSLRTGFHLVGDPAPVAGTLDDVVTDDGAPVWVLLERYVDAVQRDAIRDRLRTLFADLRVLDGSRVEVHRCFHDVGDRPCEIVGRWEKQAGAIVRTV